MKGLLRRWEFWFSLVLAVGAARDIFFHLIHEPLHDPAVIRIGQEFEPLRPLVAGRARIGYLSDEPLDTDPTKPREHGLADMDYAHAQYVLAPTILAVRDIQAELLLANFHDGDTLSKLISAQRFVVVSQPAPTVALLRRK